MANARARLVVLCVIDAEGQRVFAAEDADLLGDKSAAAVNRIYEVAARLAGTAQVPNPGGPTEFAGSVDEQRAKVATIAQGLGIKPKQ